MTISRVYACPGTLNHPPHKFRYLHHPSVEADPLPRYCGVCGWDSEGDDPPEALSMPHIAQPIGRSVDETYRQMEEGAEHRANVAMEMGLDTEAANTLKITNMKDGLREGDTSDVPVNNPVTQVMDAAPQGVFGFQDRAQGLNYSQVAHNTTIAAERNPGARAMNQLRAAHANFTANAGHAGATTSSLPALETTQPGYRRRV